MGAVYKATGRDSAPNTKLHVILPNQAESEGPALPSTMAHTRSLLLFAALTSVTLAGPLNFGEFESSTKCARTCPDASKFGYEIGKTYEYSYEADIKTTVPGAAQEHSSLHIRAIANVEVFSRCEMSLKLTDVTIKDSDPTEYSTRNEVPSAARKFVSSLERKPLRFGFMDGQVEDVCPDEEEETWVLNIKRGILSGLQNTMPDLTTNTKTREIDVTGDCEVDYTVDKVAYRASKVTKVKNMLGCVGRHNYNGFFRGAPYQVPSRVQSLPLLDSSQECEQEINSDKILLQTLCKEHHTFRPFSQGHSGANTEVTSKLAYTGETSGVSGRERRVTRRESIQFEHKPSEDGSLAGRQAATETLRKMCTETQNDVRPEVPGLFNTLVKELRKLDVDNLKAVHKSASNLCSKAEGFIHDAIPTLHSRASVSLMTDLIKNEKVTGAEADLWMTSMAFISHPCKGVLSDAKPLLDMTPPNRKAVLAVGSLVHTFCSQHADCHDEQQIKAIMRSIEESLRYNCKAKNDRQHEQVLMNLKAIGNSGFAESLVPTLNRCFMNDENSMEIRVAAINAFRRMACTAEKDELVRMLENSDADPELRIGAYLALMQCPSQDIIRRVRGLLLAEEINQVGSFIWTHLTNLMETSCPFKQQIRLILESESLKKTFDLDKRKFSRNIEWSMFSEMFNLGAVVDSNLVWSHKSFVPRSAMVNLTVDVFGQSINLIELGGRAEGLDRLLEDMFAGQDMNSLFKREKRSAISPDHVDNFDGTFKEKESGPSGSYYIRMFGNEIRYSDFHGLDMSALEGKLNYLQWLIDLAKEHSIDLTKNIPMIDSELVVPTAVGMPLALAVEGSAAVDLKIKGKMDLRKIAAAPRSVDIDGSIRPSAAIEISGEMGVDATLAKTGLKLVTTLHTSTVTEGKIQLQDGKIFNLDINMPDDKMEIISAETKFYVTYRGNEREQPMITDNRLEKYVCSGTRGAKVTGLELCGELTFPRAFHKEDAPWFPLTGPTSAKLTLYKRDSYRGFHFEASHVQDKEGGKIVRDTAKVSMSTPGGSQDREFTTEFTLNRGDKSLSLYMKSPWNKADISGSLLMTDEMKRVEARAIIDDSKTYSALAEVDIQPTKYNTKYKPRVEVAIHGRNPYKLGGTILYRPMTRADIDLKLDNVFTAPLTVKGNVRAKNSRYETSLEISSPVIEGKVEGFSLVEDKSYTSRLELNYQLEDKPKETITLNNKFKNLSARGKTQFELDSSVTTTSHSQYNSDISLEYMQDGTTFSSSVDVGLTDRKQKRVKVTVSGNDKSTRKLTGYAGMLKLQVPYKSIDYEMSVDHSHSWDGIQSKGTLKYAPNKEINIEVDLKKESSSPLKASADVKVSIPGREFGFTETLEEKNPKEYHQNIVIRLDTYEDVTITSVYKMKPRHEFTTDITLPSFKPIHVETYMVPDLKNFQSHALINFEEKQYSFDADWTHEAKRNSFSTEGNFDFVHPLRHVTLKGKAENKGNTYSGSLNTKWDADNDKSKKFVVSGEVAVSEARPSFQVKSQWWPSQYMEFSGSLKNDKNGWWHPTRDLDGRIDFKTSFFPDFDHLSFAFKHDQSEKEVQTHGEVSWNTEEKIEGDFNLKKISGWSNIETSVAVTTPFAFKTLRYELEYNQNGKSLTGVTKAMWNDEQMALTWSGQLDKASFEGTTTFTSPFPYYKRLSLSAKHNHADKINTEVEASWAREKAVKAVFEMDHTIRGWYMTNNGELTLTTPFDSYNNNKLSWTHQNDRGGVKTHADLSFDSVKTEFDLDSTVKTTGRKHEYSFKSTFKSPYEPVEDLELSFNHEHMSNSWDGMTTSAKAQWASGASITFDHDLNVQDASGSSKLKITNPLIDGFEILELNTNVEKQGKTYIFDNELKLGENKKITLEGSWKKLGPIIDGELRFTSPFSPVERLLLTTSNKYAKGVWNPKMAFEYAPDKRFEINSKYGFGLTNIVGLELLTPCPYLKSFAVDVEQSGSLRDFNTKASFELKPLVGRTSIDVQMDTKSVDNIKGEIDIETPFEDYESLKGVISHKKKGDGYISSTSIECPQHKVTLNHEIFTLSQTGYSCHTDLEYMPGKKIELDVDFSMKDKYTAGVTLKTPFEKLEEFATRFSHEGDAKNFKTSVELSYEPNNQRFSGDVEFEMKRASVKGGVTVTTPFEDYEKLNVKFSQQGTWTDFKCDGSVGIGSMTMSSENIFKLKGTKLELSTGLQIPFTSVKAVSLNVNHNGKFLDFSNNAEIGYGDKKISGETSFKLQGLNMELQASLETPFKALKTCSLKVNHNGEISDFSNSAEIQYNDKKITVGSEYETTKKGFSSKFQIRSPYKDIRNLVINVDHNGRWKNFKNSATINYNGQRFSADSNYKMAGKNIKASLTFKTPDVYSIIFNHKGTRWDFANTAKLNLNGKKYIASSEFEKKGNRITGQAGLTSPAQYMISFNHNGPLTDFQNTAQLKIKKTTYEASSEFHINGNQYTGGALVKVPEEYGFKFSHDFNGNGKKWRLQESSEVTVGGDKYIKEILINMQSPYSATATFKGPQYNINFEMEKVNSGLTGSGNVDILGKTYTGTTEFKKEGNTITGGISVNIPEEYGLNFRHEGTSKNFKNDGEVKYNGKSYTASSEFRMQRQAIHGSAAVNIIKPFALSFTHTGQINDFNSNAEVSFDGQKYTGESKFKMNAQEVEMSTSVKVPEEYGVGFTHKASSNGFTETAEIIVGNKKYTTTGTYEKSGKNIDVSGSLTTPYKKYKNFGFNFNHKSSRNGFETNSKVTTSMKGYDEFTLDVKHTNIRGSVTSSIDLQTPISGYDTFGIEAKYEGDISDLKGSVKITTPFPQMKSGTASVTHQGQLSDFTSTVGVDYDGNKIEGQAKFKKSGTWFEDDHEGHLRLTTPYGIIKEVDFKLNNQKKSTAWNGNIEATYNGAKHLDADYKFDMGSVQNVEVNIRQPQPLSASANLDQSRNQMKGDAEVAWDSSRYGLTFGLKNEQTKKKVGLSVKLPFRTIGFTTEYELDDGRFSHKSEVQWDSDANTKFSYDIEGTKAMRGNRHLLDGSIKIKSRHVNFDGHLAFRCTPGRRHELEFKLQDLTLKTDITTREPALRNTEATFTVKHPSLTKDLVLSVEGIIKPEVPHFEGKVTTSFANQKVEFMGKIADESASSDDLRHVAEARLTHPGSDLDFHFTSELYNNAVKVGGVMETSYLMSRTRTNKITNLRAEIDKVRKQLNLQSSNPVLPTQLTITSASGAPTERRINVDGTIGDKPVRGEVAITMDNPGFDFTFYYTPDDLLRVYAKMLNPSIAEFKAYREVDGDEIPELVLSVRLNNSRLVHGRAHMRPELPTDLRALKEREYGWSATWSELSEQAAQEYEMKKSAVITSLQPVSEMVDSIGNDMNTKYTRLSRAAKYMYNKNEFHMKDIYTKLTEYHEQLCHYYERRMIELNHAWKNFKQQAYQNYKNMVEEWNTFREQAEAWYQETSTKAKEYAETMCEAIEEWKKQMREAYPQMAAQYDAMLNSIYTSYMEMVDRVRNHPTVRTMVNTISNFEMPFADWRSTLKHQSGWLADAYGEWKVDMKDKWEEMKTRPGMGYVKDWIEYATIQSQWAYEYYKIEENVLSVLQDIRENGLDNIKLKIAAKLSDYFQWEKTRVTVWDEEMGEYQAELYLPFPMHDLQSLPKAAFRIRRYIIQARNTIKNYLPEDNNWNFWDTFYRYKPTGDFYDWIPPFEGHAAISGSQHFMTFDKTFYEFSGECSYLLARDFIDGKFSVVVNYGNVRGEMTKKSISVFVGEKEIEILPEFKVLVNSKQTEMPFVYETTAIRRIGSSIRVDNEHGITVTCDLPHDHCTVNVTGWYYGKTGGLLGTYDNEPATDFINSERAKVEKPEELAASWTVGRRCSATNNARMVTPDPNSRTYKTCAKYFESSSSPFRLCFKQVDNMPFMKMCVNDLVTRPNAIESVSDVCNTAAFYVDECKRRGVPIRMPKSCVSCELPGSKRLFYEGETHTLKDKMVPKSADVILVVAHQTCNTEVIDKISDIVTLTNRALKAEGMNDNRFGLVGYGGEGVFAMPHSHTLEGELFNSPQKFASILDFFKPMDTKGSDTMAAIGFAAKYPFRTGVSKSIIVIPCEKCTERSLRYGDLQQLLIDRDIHLHVLMQHNFELPKSDIKTSYIFGTDRKGAYTQKHTGDNDLVGDKGLRKQIEMPKDLCVALTEETDGSVWNSLKLIEGKPVNQKRFVDVMARLTAVKATPTECQICDCQPEEQTGVGMAVCRNCEERDPIYDMFPGIYFEDYSDEDDSDESSEEVAVPEVIKPKRPPTRPKTPRARNPRRKNKNKERRPRNMKTYRKKLRPEV